MFLDQSFGRAATALREYQARDVERIGQAKDPLYVLPTGGGKTVVAATLIEPVVARGERVLVLTHRREILQQTSLKMPVEHGLIQAGLNVDLDYQVQIASIQTLWSRCMRTDKLSLPAANLIIVDEAHHVGARTWRKILDQYPNAKRVGLTATPCRADGRGLGDYFSELIVGPQIPELIALRYLVPTVYYAPTEPNLAGVETRQGDYVISQLSGRMNRDDLVGDIVTNWHRHGGGRRTLVFCCDVAHSLHVCAEFVKASVKAEHVDGSTPKPERDAILRRLQSGETTVVANCMVLTEGFDCPPVGCIMLARPTKQLGLYRQMAGRGLRPAPGKPDLILIDHSGAVYRHGLLEDEVHWTLDVDRRAENPTHARRTRDTTQRLVECSQCSALRKGGEACPACGFQPRRKADGIVFRDGELARVDRNSRTAEALNDPSERARWHAMLAWIAAERGYKPGWAAYKFKERFGVWPPWGAKPVPIEPTRECLSWVRSRQIAYAKTMVRAG